jgi:hypothetical protein
MKELPINNEDLVDHEFQALPHVEENLMLENQGSLARSSQKGVEASKLYQTLAKFSVGSSVAESSGLTQLELF